MDVVFEKSRGRIVAFSVNYRARRARFDDEWHEVIRYDTHHGRLHVHRFWPQKGRQIEALDAAQADIAGRWREYRHHLARRLP